MNKTNASQLIEESDLRAALQPWRTDPELFAAKVRQRIDAAELQLTTNEDSDQTRMTRSEWLQTAAAVIPIPLLGKGASGGLVKLGQLSLGKKLVAWAALPAIGLLLMVAASIWAFIKIRQAERGQPVGSVDAAKLNEVTAGWWRQFGLSTAVVSIVMLLLIWTGYTLPLFVIFLLSGAAMVTLISRLGQAGLVDRRTIAGALGPGLIMLVQLTQSATMFSHGYPFLDQSLIPTVLVLGGLVVMLACEWPSLGARTWFTSIGLILLAGWFSASVWNPVSTRELKNYVQSFDYARHSSASWQQWQVVAQWLHDADIPVDLSKPHALLQKELLKPKPNPWVLCYAIEGHVMQTADLDRLPDFNGMKKRLFDQTNQRQPFVSIGYEPRTVIRALVLRDELSEEDRDYLGDRLVATMESLKSKSYVNLLEDQLIITELAALINRPIDIDAFRDFVHQTLISHQCLGHRLGTQPGGFSMSTRLKFSDQYATAAAIQLMHCYGVPSGIRIDALRSHLRPTGYQVWFGALRAQTYIRDVSLRRMQSLPGVQPIAWTDYLRYEQNLLMAVLFTLVCVFATLGASQRS